MSISKRNKAPEFARQFREKLSKKGITQKKLHDLTGISLSNINRIVKDGYGNLNEIGMLVNATGLPQNEKFNLLVRRTEEVSEGPAKEILKHGLHLYRTPDEYLTDACPVPLNRAYAAAYFGISYQEVKAIAEKFGIKDINKPNLTNSWDILDFLDEFKEKYSKEAAQAILKGDSSRKYPSVLQMNFNKELASKYVEITNGTGSIIFDVPHVVLTYYKLGKGGKIGEHSHKGGIEFAYSLEGEFKLIYEKTEYPKSMTKDGPIYIYDARKDHSIELKGCVPGKLVIIRFYPDKRKLKGHTKDGEVSL
jgi:transcriptional regulator with XRE-family HTH domain